MGNSKVKLKGGMMRYIELPLYMNILWIAAAIICFVINVKAGIAVALGACIYLVFSLTIYFVFKPTIVKRLVEFGAHYSQVQRQMLRQMDVPYGLLDETGKVLWTNKALEQLIEEKNIKSKSISSFFEELDSEVLNLDEEKRKELSIKHGDKNFFVTLKDFTLETGVNEQQVELLAEGNNQIIAMYMFDQTEIVRLQKENKDEKLIAGHIYIDNYDEVLQSVEAARRTLLVALIDRKINKYFEEYDGIVRKLEKDKYFVIFKNKYISKMQTNKFSVLDEVKTVNIGNGLPITVSIGIGMGDGSLASTYELAGTAIDMALGRGGDQAVIKDGNKVYYYGGKSKSVEKNTKVKSRVKATAFRDLIESKEVIYIMGHHIGDNDSFGSSIGFYRIAKTIGKEAHIVLGQVSSTAAELVNTFTELEEYENVFVTGAEAAEKMTKNDALIIVDCCRANYTEYPELVRRSQCLLVFDHHRQPTDVIDNAQLSYIELSASSTCEMVVEIMQYIPEVVKITKQEAEAVYGGIMIDTNNFTNRTGVRTFEAAAYLRKNGADVGKVNRMFRDDLGDYKAKATAIQNTEVFEEAFAITVCHAEHLTSPTVVGAQAANELLNIKNIKASFVCTPYNDQIYISARSVDKFNVQLMMEELGGGGHINLAGAQVKDKSITEVIDIIKNLIRQRIEEGDI